VARWLLFSVVYALMGPVVALSRRRAEELDAQHMRDVQEARRGRHSPQSAVSHRSDFDGKRFRFVGTGQPVRDSRRAPQRLHSNA
jgi:hypothetical protein